MSDAGIVWTFAVEPPSYRIEDMRRAVRKLGKALRSGANLGVIAGAKQELLRGQTNEPKTAYEALPL